MEFSLFIQNGVHKGFVTLRFHDKHVCIMMMIVLGFGMLTMVTKIKQVHLPVHTTVPVQYVLW